MKDFLDRTGLVWSPRNHGFLWGWGHGHLLWAPRWVRKLIVHTVNPLMCRIYGHSVFGPIEEDGEIIVEKSCYMCCSRDV